MTESELRHLLVSRGVISGTAELTRITESTFRADDPASGQRLAVKTVRRCAGRGVRGIEEAKRLIGTELKLVQPVKDLIYVDDDVIALLDWIDGRSLKSESRSMLPAFFTDLRSWHESNRGAGAIYSPHASLEYESVLDFIESEVTHHLNNAGAPGLREVCIRQLSGLRRGFTTVLHGDVHPGNIVVERDRFVLLDPEYVHRGVNLLDLDYIEYFATGTATKPWWAITRWARECVGAYFSGDSFGPVEIGKTMHSVQLLSSLRSITNSLVYKTGNTDEAILRVRRELDAGV